jgi:hypothetical protein
MKTACLNTMVISLMLFCTSVLQAQVTKLNQLELFKQYNGNWKGEPGKDSTFLWEGKNTSNGIEARTKLISKGKVLMESRTVVVYDKKDDKCIATQIQGSDTLVFAWWFTSKSTSDEVQIQYMSNPGNAPVLIRYEFKTPDIVVQTFIANKKPVRTDTYTRIK